MHLLRRSAAWLAEGRISEEAVLRMADWLEPLLRRESYLALLMERPAVHERLLRVLGAARTAALGLGAIMVVAAILLISTTIRLSAMSREQETQIMRYVGASNLFIQAPFMIEGALAALVGAAFAIGPLFAGVHFIVQGWLAPSFKWTNFIGMAHVGIMSPILIAAAVLLAIIASAFSLAKYTRA